MQNGPASGGDKTTTMTKLIFALRRRKCIQRIQVENGPKQSVLKV